MYDILKKKKSSHASFPKHFTSNDDNIHNHEEIASIFNIYFVSVGLKLAERILEPTAAEVLNENLLEIQIPYFSQQWSVIDSKFRGLF